MSTEQPPQRREEPTAEQRRAAVLGVLSQAPGLVRFAARYTRSIHDAEDAYQRAMEIALRRAPVVEPRQFVAWLHAVIRNEAISIVRGRQREGPAPEEDLAVSLADRAADLLGPDAVAEWRERYRGLRAGLNALTEAQRVCLMLKSAGASYAEIAAMTGFSMRKIERSILEGRAALHGWELKISRGDECGRVLPALNRVADEEGSRRDERLVSRHVKRCASCRALLGRRRETGQGLAALVPPALVAPVFAPSGPPDPSHAISWWERVVGGATVRAGTTWQQAMELSGLLGSKVGAGTVAAVAAGAVGVPLVADAVRDTGATLPPAPAAVVRPAPRAAMPPVAVRVPALPRPTSGASRRPHDRAPTAHTRSLRAAPSSRRAARPARAHPRPRTVPAPAPPPFPRSASLEFGP